MYDPIFIAVDKVIRCINTSDTLAQLATSRQMFLNLIRLYGISDTHVIYKRLQHRLMDRQGELFDIINKEGKVK